MLTPDERLEVALDLRRRGLELIPVRRQSKIPCEHGWTEAPALTEAGIRSAIAAGQNLGVRCGPVVVLDEDRRGALDELAKAVGVELPRTLTVRTGRGGTHRYYRQAPGLELGNRTHINGVELDIRGAGGFAVAPGSIHENGSLYEIEDPAEIAMLPEGLAAYLGSKRNGSHGPAIPTPAPAATRRAAAALERECAAVSAAPQGARNATLNRASFNLGQLVASGELDETETVQALQAAAEAAGLPAGEAARTIQSGVGGGKLQPRAKSENPSDELRPVIEAIGAVGAALADPSRARINVTIGRGDETINAEVEAQLDRRYRGRIFQRDGAVVLVTDAPSAPDGTPPTVPVRVESFTSPMLAEKVSECCDFFVRRANGSTVPARFRAVSAAAILDRKHGHPYPELRGVMLAPTLRRDGTIAQAPGYDPASGLFLAFDDGAFPPIPESPTRDDATDAAWRVLDFFDEFPFKHPSGPAAALSLALSIAVRPMIDGPVPLYGVGAPTPGTGKSLLARAAAIAATGREPKIVTPPTDPDEDRKLLFSVAREGCPAAIVDNATAAFGSASWAKHLTATETSERVLGESRTETHPATTVWCVTGNGLRFKSDCQRRVVLLTLEVCGPLAENPEDRSGFRLSPLDEAIKAAHPGVLVDLLTIARAFAVAGRPAHGLPLKGSFESWDRIVRGAVLWTGIGDPRGEEAELRSEGDADTSVLAALIEAWREHVPPGEVTLARVVNLAADLARRNEPDLQAAIDDFCGGRTTPRVLGRRLAVVRDRPCHGARFVRDGSGKRGAASWRLESSGA